MDGPGVFKRIIRSEIEFVCEMTYHYLNLNMTGDICLEKSTCARHGKISICRLIVLIFYPILVHGGNCGY